MAGSVIAGNIGDFCNQDDLGCMATNSYCKVSICACVAGYIPSMDNSQCVGKSG